MATEGEGKRKRPAQEDAPVKRKRRKGVKGMGEVDEADLDVEAGVNKAFERMESQLLADHVAQRTNRFGTDLSSVELADLYVSANAIKDTTTWEKPRTLENLPEFLEAFTPDPTKLSQASRKKGSPHTIIVAGAGLRAVNMVRSVRKFQTKGNTVAKLFAKHIKLEEAVKFLQSNRTGVAVGTPQRLMDLLDSGALSLEVLQRVVVDASHIDQKKRGIMDMKETMLPLAKWLTRKELTDRYTAEEKHIDLLFY